MADQRDVLGVVIALEFVVVGAVVLLLVPLEAAAPIVPLLLVLSFALYRYRF